MSSGDVVRVRWCALGLALVVLLAAGCGSSRKPSGALDASGDAAVDGAADVALEAGADASADAETDAPAEASPDAQADASGDAPADASIDAPADASPDAPADASIDAPPPPPLSLAFEGGFVRKVEVRADAFYVLIDPPLNLSVDWGHPRRELRLVGRDGHEAWHLSSSPDRELLDFALHPSGEVTALFASTAGFRLTRLGADGVAKGELLIVDAAIDTDLPKLPDGVVSAPIEQASHDAGAIAALGEDAVVAVRTGRHSVVAHRLAFVDGAFTPRFRTLVIPAHPISPIGLRGGTYDTFGAVDSQYFVQLAVGPDAMIYVGVRHPELTAARLVKAFKDVLGETLTTDPDATDSFVVRLAADGTRLGTSVVGTERPDEVFALRAVEGGAWALGRNELWNESGTGFDAFIGFVERDAGVATARSLDVELGDIAFDLAPLPGGDVIVVGASGYTQNPSGASISEGSAPFARWLRSDGGVVPIAVPPGPRHNEARTITVLPSGRLLVGGMHDGPGTHSADGDTSLLSARGFLVELALGP